MSKYLFIDTNLYRNLLQSESTTILDKLEKLTKENGYEILLPQQVIDEINRGRSTNWFNPKNNENLEKLRDLLKKSKDIINSNDEIETVVKKIDDQVNENATHNLYTRKELINPEGLVEKNLEKLKTISRIIPDSKEAMDKAYLRTMKGNPPYEISEEKRSAKLNTKICDAYIWEQIKEFFGEKPGTSVKLLFFSENINDWCIDTGEEKIFHPFLQNEIKNELNIDLNWFRSLEELPKLTQIEKESIQGESLEIMKQKVNDDFLPNLLESNSWSYTDRLINRYSNYTDKLTEEDVTKILQASLDNNQISLGPYNQVLMASKAVEFFSKLYKHSMEKGFSIDPWIKFYEDMDDESRKSFSGLKQTLLIQHDYYYNEGTKKMMFIPF